MAGAMYTVILPDGAATRGSVIGYPKTVTCGLRDQTIVLPQMLHLKLCNLDLSVQLQQPVDPLLFTVKERRHL